MKKEKLKLAKKIISRLTDQKSLQIKGGAQKRNSRMCDTINHSACATNLIDCPPDIDID